MRAALPFCGGEISRGFIFYLSRRSRTGRARSMRLIKVSDISVLSVPRCSRRTARTWFCRPSPRNPPSELRAPGRRGFSQLIYTRRELWQYICFLFSSISGLALFVSICREFPRVRCLSLTVLESPGNCGEVNLPEILIVACVVILTRVGW